MEIKKPVIEEKKSIDIKVPLPPIPPLPSPPQPKIVRSGVDVITGLIKP